MIPSDMPWSGLEAGLIDTRRVSASARWNWYWAVLPRDDAALVLQLSALPMPLPDLPKLGNLEIKFQTLPGGPILYIRLKDNAQIELFETFCRDVIAAGESRTTEAEALESAVGRTFRWHYLLRGGRGEILSEEAQKGLIGELAVLRLLIAEFGPKAALDAWTGPSGAPKDFECEAGCIEVKARRGASQPFVKISNEFQLADVEGRHLWLAVMAVDRVQEPNGYTLSEHVAEVTGILQAMEPSAIMQLDLHLADVGFDAMHDYSPWRWVVAEPAFHSVEEGFPRLAGPVPLGVSDVTYSVALSACAPFRRDWAEVSASLANGTQS